MSTNNTAFHLPKLTAMSFMKLNKTSANPLKSTDISFMSTDSISNFHQNQVNLIIRPLTTKKLKQRLLEDVYSILRDLSPSQRKLLDVFIYVKRKFKVLTMSQQWMADVTGYTRQTMNEACKILDLLEMVFKYNRGFMNGRPRTNVYRMNPLFFTSFVIEALYVQLPALRWFRNDPTLVSNVIYFNNLSRQSNLNKQPTLERGGPTTEQKEATIHKALGILAELGLIS